VRRAIAVLIVTILFAFVGPALTSARGKTAGTAFVYEPPEGFKHPTDKFTAGANTEVWVIDENLPGSMVPIRNPNPTTVAVTQSAKLMSVEERDLAKLVEEMPGVFDNCTWVHRRHELRTRADGARVGIIEGDCDKEMDLSSFGLPAKTIKQRKLQMMFPNDEGTAIVTASYVTEQATRWEPLFEATIAKAKGVATRTPPPPSWMYGAWGFAGLVIAWLATAIVMKPRPEAAKPEPEKKKKAKKSAPEAPEED
jgi:hypothetical protein